MTIRNALNRESCSKLQRFSCLLIAVVFAIASQNSDATIGSQNLQPITAADANAYVTSILNTTTFDFFKSGESYAFLDQDPQYGGAPGYFQLIQMSSMNFPLKLEVKFLSRNDKWWGPSPFYDRSITAVKSPNSHLSAQISFGPDHESICPVVDASYTSEGATLTSLKFENLQYVNLPSGRTCGTFSISASGPAHSTKNLNEISKLPFKSLILEAYRHGILMSDPNGIYHVNLSFTGLATHQTCRHDVHAYYDAIADVQFSDSPLKLLTVSVTSVGAPYCGRFLNGPIGQGTKITTPKGSIDLLE